MECFLDVVDNSPDSFYWKLRNPQLKGETKKAVNFEE